MSPIQPKKSLGQHFLVDDNILDVIGRLAGLEPTDVVFEVGPGLGVLTRYLSERVAFIHAAEVDRRLWAHLAEIAHTEVHWGDALHLDIAALDPPPTKLVANLPYNIATPLLAGMLSGCPEIGDFVVMVQREVGERLIAPPGSKAYGAVSVLVAYHCTARLLGRIPPTVFWPAPTVESVLIRLTRRPPPVAVAPASLMRVVHAAFGQRRKTVRNSLASVLGLATEEVERALAAAGLDPGARAETFGLEEFARLTEALSGALRGASGELQ